MTIKEYLPAFFSGFELSVGTFETKEQLEAVPWIREKITRGEFSRLSVYDDMLMMELQTGKYFVIGRFLDGVPAFLPVFQFQGQTETR